MIKKLKAGELIISTYTGTAKKKKTLRLRKTSNEMNGSF